jgi:hypothetical protein
MKSENSEPEGSLAILDPSGDPSGPGTSFMGDVAGIYKVKLIVSNGLTDSDPAYAEIIVIEGQQLLFFM